MDPTVLSIIGIIVFLFLLFIGMQIGIAMALVGFVGYWLFTNFGAAFGALKSTPFTTSANFSLSVIPLFVLMGQIAFYSGISSDLYNACYKWLGRVRGGLGISTLAACALFSAICGSATATVATLGTVCLPEMQKYKYKDSLSCGLISSGGTMGILIPPSVGFIIYGTIAEQSIGALFAAGIVPGLLLMVLFMITVVIITKKDPSAGPKGESFPLREMLISLKGVIAFIILFLLVLGGIFGGWFTPSEGGAIGAFGSLVFMVIRRKATLANLKAALSDSIKTTAMIFMIMIGAYIFGYFLTISRMPMALARIAVDADVSPYIILIFVLLVYTVLGCFIDAIPLTIILVPIFLPIILGLGFNPIWFGVIIILAMQIGLLTPPVGMCCYVMSGVAKDIPLQTIFRGVLPFIATIVVAAVFIIIFPQIALWLPGLFYAV
ncbi:MAG: C4-dicarboxylate ABC transporter permease [Firmicutes bacterium HGW-Firmicutes-11]|jgi:tripartite ATP-independent transporter DctM subunit|nr:MAG: C4-dicarboxylate ABC transporter permease [Firmicutes bacterium HGW-Firmicutes-11]